MELKINTDINKNQIIVTDVSTTYLEEDDPSFSLNCFRKSDTQSIVIASINKLKGEEVATSTIGNIINIDRDGWLTIYYLVLPTKEWFIRASKTSNILDLYDIVYYVSKGNVYWYQSDTQEFGQVHQLQELIDLAQLPNVKTTLSYAKADRVSIFNLEKCYINLCQQIFESRGFSQCYNKNNIDLSLIHI